MAGVLDGIRIIDLTLHQVGPLATALLADLGAEVIKVEEPERGDLLRGNTNFQRVPLPRPGGRQINFEAHNRSKKGLAIDLKQAEGREVVYGLAKTSHAFVTNFRPQALKKLGLEYETIRKVNPKIVYARASGFGDRGPHRNMPAIDPTIQARSGLQMGSGEKGSAPVWLPGGITDGITAVYLAYGVLAGLMARERFGIGQEINASMLAATIHIQQFLFTIRSFVDMGSEFPRWERGRPYSALWHNYKCKDGKWLALTFTLQDAQYWPTFCKAINMPELETDTRFATTPLREENAVTLAAILETLFLSRTRTEWFQALDPYELFIGPANTLTEVFDDPQVIANRIIRDWDHPSMGKIKFVSHPVEFGETPAKEPGPAPELGEHTIQLLDALGYNDKEIRDLQAKGVIRR